jgi:hypothetical protein
MTNTAEYLKLYEEILALIDRRRAEVGDPFLGSEIESFVLDNQFRELEDEIFKNPGAIEPWFVPRRRRT